MTGGREGREGWAPGFGDGRYAEQSMRLASIRRACSKPVETTARY